MPGATLLKCAECHTETAYKDIKYIGGAVVLNHKPACSTAWQAIPRYYITRQETPLIIEL